jgi:hypothetical protein
LNELLFEVQSVVFTKTEEESIARTVRSGGWINNNCYEEEEFAVVAVVLVVFSVVVCGEVLGTTEFGGRKSQCEEWRVSGSGAYLCLFFCSGSIPLIFALSLFPAFALAVLFCPPAASSSSHIIPFLLTGEEVHFPFP